MRKPARTPVAAAVIPLTATSRDWATLRAHLNWIYHDRVADAWRKGSFPNMGLAAILMVKGSLTVEHGGRRVRARAGEWMIPTTALYHQTFSADAEVLSIRYQAHWLDGQPLFDPSESLVFAAADFPKLEQAAWRMWMAVKKLRLGNPVSFPFLDVPLEGWSRVQIEFLRFLPVLSAVFSRLALRPTRVGICDERVLRSLAWLNRLPFSHRFREEQLEAHTGLGTRQFVRLFRKEVGVTPRQYVERRRMEACVRLLCDAPLPIKQIAAEMGFAHLSDFSTWFKSHHGESPREMRKRRWGQKKRRPLA